MFYNDIFEALKMTTESKEDEKFQNFQELLNDQLESMFADYTAEIGIGLITTIEVASERGFTDKSIIKIVINKCRDMIAKSPESALEYKKELERKKVLE